MRVDDLQADFVTAAQQFRGGLGISIFESVVVASPAGASVELRRFTQLNPIAMGAGIRIVAGGSVANNANAKSIALGVNSLNPAGQISVSPAINTTNIWLFDVSFLLFAAGSVVQWGTAYTGPSAGTVTATSSVFIPNRGLNLTVPGNFFVFIGTQVAAADITFNMMYVTPLILPA